MNWTMFFSILPYVAATLSIVALLYVLLKLRRKQYRATRCGHQTYQKGQIVAFGEHTTTEMPLNNQRSVDWCLACIEKMAIPCAWCEKPIFIGDPVTLYSPVDKTFEIPDHAVIYDKERLQLVGCLRWECADTGADRAGFWLPGDDGNGHVERVPTAYEILQASGAKSPVVIHDIHDIDEAHNHPVISQDEK